jgi:TatD DNase family protein
VNAPLVDTHCHINFDSYDEDRDQVIERAAQVGVTRVINPAVDVETSKTVVELAARYEGLYAAVGVHPNSTARFAPEDLTAVESLAKAPKVVAIGEIGLDYYRDRSPKSAQVAAFEAQLALAAKLELPVIIHNREAHDDILSILEHWVSSLPPSLKARPGVLHSFSAPAAIAERALKTGFCLGFTGPITYKNADDLRRIAASMPLDHILVETDGPFLTPMPYRGKRNEPAYIPYIVQRLAALKRIGDEAMAQATTENAERLFDLDSRR